MACRQRASANRQRNCKCAHWRPVKLLLDNILARITCDIPKTIRITKNIDSAMCRLQEDGISQDDKRIKLSTKLIQSYAQTDMERLRSIEDKARITAIGITLALSLVLAGSGRLDSLINGQNSFLMYLSDILTVLTALYFLMAAFWSLRALQVKSIFHVSLEDHVEICDFNKMRLRHLEVLDLNRKLITKNINFIEVSYNALINGIFCTVLVILTLTLAKFVAPKRQSPDFPDRNFTKVVTIDNMNSIAPPESSSVIK